MARVEIVFNQTGGNRWQTEYKGQKYLVDQTIPNKWHLYVRVNVRGPANWVMVQRIRTAEGHQPVGSTLEKALQNTARFLVFGTTPGDLLWEE